MADVSITEKKLEDFVFDHLSGGDYIPGFDEYLDGPEPSGRYALYRQLSLGNYGVADIVSFEVLEPGFAWCGASIYELKQGVIDVSSVLQVMRYRRGLQHVIRKYDIPVDEEATSCILIGSHLTQVEDFDISTSAIPHLYIYTYDIDPRKGISLIDQNRWQRNSLDIPGKTIKKFMCIDYLSHDLSCKSHWRKKNYREKHRGV